MAESECGAVGDVQASKEETATAMWRLFAKDVSIPSNGCLFLEKNRSLLHALEPSFAVGDSLCWVYVWMREASRHTSAVPLSLHSQIGGK